MNLSLIWAMDTNKLIGRDNKLPWQLSADLIRFKKLTMGNNIIMGRKTYESIGKLLPGRNTIILTRQNQYTIEGARMFYSSDALFDFLEEHAGNENFIIGGYDLYKLSLPFANKLYLTQVHGKCQGNVYFPAIDWNKWKLVSDEYYKKDAKNQYDYSFLNYLHIN